MELPNHLPWGPSGSLVGKFEYFGIDCWIIYCYYLADMHGDGVHDLWNLLFDEPAIFEFAYIG